MQLVSRRKTLLDTMGINTFTKLQNTFKRLQKRLQKDFKKTSKRLQKDLKLFKRTLKGLQKDFKKTFNSMCQASETCNCSSALSSSK